MKKLLLSDDPRLQLAGLIDALYAMLVSEKTLTEGRALTREMGQLIYEMGERKEAPYGDGHSAMAHAYHVVEHLWTRDGRYSALPNGCHPAEISHAWDGVGSWLT